MDSIVDSFFPLIDFIESESNEISAFLSDPLTHLPSGRFGYKKKKLNPITAFDSRPPDNSDEPYPDEIVGISVETPSEDAKKELDLDLTTSRFSAIKVSTRLRRRVTTNSSSSGSWNSYYRRLVPSIRLPISVIRILPERLAVKARTDRIVEKTMLADDQGIELYPLGGETGIDMTKLAPTRFQHGQSSYDKRHRGEVSKRDDRFDNRVMLNRITDMRKLVTGLSRLLGPKRDVVRGLRKRTMADAKMGLFKQDSKHDISVYIGDLFGEDSFSAFRVEFDPKLICLLLPRCRSHSRHVPIHFLLRRSALSRSPYLPRHATNASQRDETQINEKHCSIDDCNSDVPSTLCRHG
jgi:Mg2+ and Co2+ transporter CorA